MSDRDAEAVSSWGERPAHLDDFLQGKLNRELPASSGSWSSQYRVEPYQGARRALIWEAFGYLYDAIGDPSGTVAIATTETLHEIDFRLETFAAATGITAGGTAKDWLVMGSSSQQRMLESDETHSERKILAAMRPPSRTDRLPDRAVEGAFVRAGMPPTPGVKPPSRTQMRSLHGQSRWLGAFEGGWTDTLFILVTRSPCHDCSEALAQALGTGPNACYGRLVVAFCTYYKGGVGAGALPSAGFHARLGGDQGPIELYKIHWTGTTDEFLESCHQPRRAYWHVGTAPVRRAQHPISPNGTPYDPRYTLLRLLPR